MRQALLLLMLIPLVARADEDLTVLNSDAAPRKMLQTYLLAECQKHFDARKLVLDAIKTPQELIDRENTLRQKFIESLGGFPEKTPLNAQVVGKLDREGYRVERIVFESRPGHHVTANLYLPVGKGPFPAVLMPLGHSNNGKVSMQTHAILLARHGIAAMPYDPISQGERKQLLDEKGKPFISSMTSEHSMITVGAVLVGRSTASYRIWDGIRAIDYLVSRPEIDGKRLGCTGCSGGGTLTSYLMALDDRIYAAAPSCYITTLERLFATRGPQDAEQNITGQVAFGMDHADYLLMRAPKPTLLLAAKKDFFDIEGTRTTFNEAKRFFKLHGFPERVDMVETDTEHGYPKVQREPMLRFMSRWLLNKDEALTEEPAMLDKEADLICTRTGQVLEDLKGKSCFDLTAERARDLAKSRESKEFNAERLRKEIAATIGTTLSPPPADVKEGKAIERDGIRIIKEIYTTEKGITVPALTFAKKDLPVKKTIIYLNGLGMAAGAGPNGPIEKLVQAETEVLALDPRGMGETAAGTPSAKPGYFGTDFNVAFLALHLKRPLLGQRVGDVLAVIERAKRNGHTDFEIVGVGSAGIIALHVAALEPLIKKTTIDGGLISWMSVVTTPISTDQLTHVVPNALAVYDLPDLAGVIAPRVLNIRNAVDAALQPVVAAKVEETYAPAREIYKRLRQNVNFNVE